MKKRWWYVIAALLLSLSIELFYFNLPFFLSLTDEPANVTYTLGEGLSLNMDGTYTVVDKSKATLTLHGINDDTGYIYLDISYRAKPENETTSVQVKMQATDEGHALPYSVGQTYVWERFQKTMYLRPNFYGNALDLSFSITADNNSVLEIRGITLHANVPLFFNGLRCALIAAFIVGVLYLAGLRSFSTMKLGENRKKQVLVVTGLLIANAIALWFLVQLNTYYREPNQNWIPFTQYKLLAEALANGRVDISPWNRQEFLDKLSTLTNPYDLNYRVQETGIRTPDFAYYNDNLYVYFGIVPVLLYYLPHYLLTGTHINTWVAMYISAMAIVGGAYYLVASVIRRYYPRTPFFLYILLSMLLGNGVGIIVMLMCPYFYSLPIITALAFTIWGLGIWINAANKYSQKKKQAYILIALGSLCMALVAGCRPQFLVGSFLVFPIFWRALREREKLMSASNCKLVLVGILPYIIIASGLMYYNYIRFDSPFDFGANYNITSNDMTKRGFALGRISDGIYMYLWQLPVLHNAFPFLQTAARSFTYMGETIYEPMFGGVFFTHIFIWINFAVYRVKKQLKEKGLLVFAILCFCFAILIVIADTEMAAILPRYYNDFLWLFTLSGILVFLQLWENAETAAQQKRLVALFCIMMLAGFAIDFATGINTGYFHRDSPSSYFLLQDFFT